MIVRLRMYKYCYLNVGAISAKGLLLEVCKSVAVN